MSETFQRWLAGFLRDKGRSPLDHEIWQAAGLESAKRMRERCAKHVEKGIEVKDSEGQRVGVYPVFEYRNHLADAIRALPLEEEPK